MTSSFIYGMWMTQEEEVDFRAGESDQIKRSVIKLFRCKPQLFYRSAMQAAANLLADIAGQPTQLVMRHFVIDRAVADQRPNFLLWTTPAAALRLSVFCKRFFMSASRLGYEGVMIRKFALACLLFPLFQSLALAEAERPRYSADIPPTLLTPDSVETSIGTLRFEDGAPTPETTALVYDQLTLSRGIETFMQGIPATSVFAACRGIAEVGVKENGAFGLTEELMDARTLFLTPNTTTVYGFACMNLNAGPMVAEIPPGVLGPVDDAYFRWATDVGLTGPDKGKGGKYLFVPPGYTGALPTDGYFVVKPQTNRLLMFFRAFVEKGDIAGAVAGVKAKAKVYPLSAAASPPETVFVNTSGKKFNTISANTFEFFSELDGVVQNEPADFVSPETVGLFASVGIRKGQPFNPDARMKKILTDAVAIANGAARSFLWRPRDPRARFYPDRKWQTGFVGNSYLFADGAERLLDARSMFFYYATGITPAMAFAKPGSGSAYAGVFLDKDGNPLSGSKTYKITLPGPVPAAQFWALTVYDNQTRSLLETNQRTAGLDSNSKELKANADGSYTVWFSAKAPAGHEGNWVQTWPGKGFNVLLRLYAPLEPWFDQSWKPGDFEAVE